MNVIKRSRVQLGDSLRLPAGTAAVRQDPRPGGGSGAAPGIAAQARLIESNSDYIILEIQCGCGQKSYVQCNYGNVTGNQYSEESK